MNIIFLDIDGPLCNYRTGQREQQLDIYAMRLINKLCFERNAQIVISSTWRKIKTRDEILDKFRKHEFEGEFHQDWLTPIHASGRRGLEIKEWLDNHIYDKYVAIDDDTFDYLPEQNLVVVDSYEGFSFANYLLCDYLLGGDSDLKTIKNLLVWRIKKDSRNLKFIQNLK